MQSSLAIAVRDLQFSYKPDTPILSIPALTVAAGERVFLHGPSGSGKSTLLALISGMLLPQSGSVSVLGKETQQLSEGGRDNLRGSEIGYIFQSFNLVPYLTVLENIALPCNFHRARRERLADRNIGDEIQRLADRLEITSLLPQQASTLSIGQQQRVAIARAIIGNPPLLIADEPTSSLDVERRDAFLELLQELSLASKPALLFVSHDLSLARHFETRYSLPELNHVKKEALA